MIILFVINQLYKGGAETNLINLLKALPPEKYQIDLLIYDQLNQPNVVSLIDEIPKWVNVCNAAEREEKSAVIKKAVYRLVRDASGRQMYRRACYTFVNGKHYDAAISYGEWFVPQFVAESVAADRKLVWIHSDIDKAQFFVPERMFQYDKQINMYLFASRRSMESAVVRYPQLIGRSMVVNNLLDDTGVREDAQQAVPELKAWKRPIVLTVANFRTEKNHLRQVEAMRLLKSRGVNFTWINVGSNTDRQLIARIDQAVKNAGLQGNFVCMGAKASPYALMREADVVAVLSDFESWSLVITEAKLLGTPVLATKTSGALEQIKDGETGVLCDFSAQDIADKLEHLFYDHKLCTQIRKNLIGFNTHEAAVTGFENALNTCTKGYRPHLMYVSDNINYVSGVQRVTATQVQALRGQFNISIFSMTEPDERSKKLFMGVPIYDMNTHGSVACIAVPLKRVLLGCEYPIRRKMIRLFYALAQRVGKGDGAMQLLAGKKLSRLFEKCETICVLSEASQLRGIVSRLRKPKKIQWIHTDYALWSEYSDWTRMITKKDGDTYQRFDTIVCLTNASRNGFIAKYPHLKEKTVVIPNLQPVDEIVLKAKEPMEPISFHGDTCNIVSVGRMDTEKAVDRILRVLVKLKEEGLCFHWYFIGDGVLLDEWKAMCDELSLGDVVEFLGAKENPYPYMANASVFALLSQYEGLPVTIDEAKILGVPVIATRVGGIVEQVDDGVNGMLVDNDEEAILNGLRALLSDPERLKGWRAALREEHFDGQAIREQLIQLFATHGNGSYPSTAIHCRGGSGRA